MNPLRRMVVALVVASLGASSAVALSACGKDDVFGGDSGKQIDVSVTERDLTPARVEVRAGEVEFVVKNDGERVHEFANCVLLLQQQVEYAASAWFSEDFEEGSCHAVRRRDRRRHHQADRRHQAGGDGPHHRRPGRREVPDL